MKLNQNTYLQIGIQFNITKTQNDIENYNLTSKMIIELQNFRCHTHKKLEFDKGLNLLSGESGVQKRNAYWCGKMAVAQNKISFIIQNYFRFLQGTIPSNLKIEYK